MLLLVVAAVAAAGPVGGRVLPEPECPPFMVSFKNACDRSDAFLVLRGDVSEIMGQECINNSTTACTMESAIPRASPGISSGYSAQFVSDAVYFNYFFDDVAVHNAAPRPSGDIVMFSLYTGAVVETDAECGAEDDCVGMRRLPLTRDSAGCAISVAGTMTHPGMRELELTC